MRSRGTCSLLTGQVRVLELRYAGEERRLLTVRLARKFARLTMSHHSDGFAHDLGLGNCNSNSMSCNNANGAIAT